MASTYDRLPTGDDRSAAAREVAERTVSSDRRGHGVRQTINLR
jgi:hypothetical protein